MTQRIGFLGAGFISVEVFCEHLQITLDGTPDGPISWQFAGEEPRSLGGRELSGRVWSSAVAVKST